jgi:hypothetical protein
MQNGRGENSDIITDVRNMLDYKKDSYLYRTPYVYIKIVYLLTLGYCIESFKIFCLSRLFTHMKHSM